MPAPLIPTTIEINGFTVRHERVRAGLGVVELADLVGVKRPYIAKIELGHSQRVSPRVFNALLQVFGIQDRRVLMANPHAVDLVEVPA
jgi:predicted transcriptional regulator